MELYDEDVEQKKSKVPLIIGISVAILVITIILIIVGIIYLKNSITIISVDGVRNYDIEKLFYFEQTEEGKELYIPIIKAASFFGQKGYSGDYKDKSEDKSKCHVVSDNETTIFTKDSNIVTKTNKNSEYEYIELDKPIIEINGELYITIQGIEKTFNVLFSADNNFKNIEIYSMEFLSSYYAKKFSVEKYSTEFTDQKAILEGRLIIIENNKYGLIDLNNEYILEPKYESIKYLPTIAEFLVKNNGQYGICSIDGEMKTKIVYDEIKLMDFQKGLYRVKQNNVYGIINTNGDVIIEPEYKQIGIDVTKYSANGIDNGYILLDELIPIKNSENLWGFFNVRGEKIIDFQYASIGSNTTTVGNSYPVIAIPSSKVLIVKKDKYYKLITTDGKELIDDNILNSVYLKVNSSTGKIDFYMTYSNNTKTINVEEYLTKIGE